MASARDQELVDRFETFFREQESSAIADLARRYPREAKSLEIDHETLFRFDPDFADDLLETPSRFIDAAEEALRLYDLPVDKDLADAHVRFTNLPETTEIRDIRSEDLGTLIAVQGIVRKATSVKPKIEQAAFECLRCGTITVVPQADGDFQDPYQCDGCEREGPFQFLTEANETNFVDAQKLRIQESPEGLGGGETPEAIDMHIEDDITGEVSPGDHVTAVGILRLDDSDIESTDSRVFDMYLEGVSVTVEDEEFEEMEISEAEREEIIRLSEKPDIYEQIVDSIAPTIYGFETAKLAIALQLFSGVTKHLPDGARIRGDVHILLVGDPGTGKCVKGDTTVTLADGTRREIGELVESNLENPHPVDDGVFAETDIPVLSLTEEGSIEEASATKVWKRDAPERMYRVSLSDGSELEITPSHPLFTLDGTSPEAVPADELSTGTFVAVPRNLTQQSDNPLEVSYRASKSNNAVRVDLPTEWTPGLARLLGYIVAEGYAEIRDDNTAYVSVTNDDEAVLNDVETQMDALGLDVTKRPPHPGKSAQEYICSSSEFASFLASLEPRLLEGSAEQRVPETIFETTESIRVAFLKAYIEGEGHVSAKEREISVASVSPELLEDIRSLLLTLGIRAHFESKAGGSYRLRISGTDFDRYVRAVGFVSERKTNASGTFESTPQNTNTDVIPDVGDTLQRIRKTLALTQSDCGVPRTTFQHYERGDRNPGRESLRTVISTFESRLAELETARESLETADWETVERLRADLDISQSELASGIGVEQTTVSMYSRGEVVPDGGRVRDAREVLRDRIDAALSEAETVQALSRLAESDLAWAQITDIEGVDPEYDWVYDIEVEGTHSYLSNNVLSHNSQLLQYIRHVSPRSVYTSGKGSSAAGLTAAAVRDDFGDGQQWSLEAGALVLADKGVAAIDELDKMAADDRSAMHEALEQQSISISKAGINATLKSRCALLGAANPELGRFDRYETPANQIDLEPALISRFDLIFTVTDKPDQEKDSNLAEHILRTNYAGELNTHRSQVNTSSVSAGDVETATESVSPAIEPDLMRKYIAYARSTCFPTMTDEAETQIRDFYVDLRARGTGEDSPVPVTARKLEAIVRLAEASARVRLSDTVEPEDAERALNIVETTLKEIGMDPETGQYDADVIETGQSKSQRDRIRTIKELIADVESEFDDGAPIEEVLARAEEVDMDRSKAEHQIEKLKTQGEVYEPTTEHLRTT